MGEIDGIVPGIVVVRQLAPGGGDGYIVNPVGTEHRLRRLRAGETAAVGDPAVLIEAAADLDLGPEGQDHHRDQQKEIDVIGQEVSVATIIIRHKHPRILALNGMSQ